MFGILRLAPSARRPTGATRAAGAHFPAAHKPKRSKLSAETNGWADGPSGGRLLGSDGLRNGATRAHQRQKASPKLTFNFSLDSIGRPARKHAPGAKGARRPRPARGRPFIGQPGAYLSAGTITRGHLRVSACSSGLILVFRLDSRGTRHGPTMSRAPAPGPNQARARPPALPAARWWRLCARPAPSARA